MTELGRVGYARMSLGTISELAGTTKTTLYTRYPSKAKLATAAIESLRRRTPREPTGDTRIDLMNELNLFRRGALRPHGMSMLGAVLAEEHDNPELLALFRKHVVKPRRDNLRRILTAGVTSGQISKTADLETAITMMVGSLYATYVSGQPVRADWPQRVVDAWLQANRRPP